MVASKISLLPISKLNRRKSQTSKFGSYCSIESLASDSEVKVIGYLVLVLLVEHASNAKLNADFGQTYYTSACIKHIAGNHHWL